MGPHLRLRLPVVSPLVSESKCRLYVCLGLPVLIFLCLIFLFLPSIDSEACSIAYRYLLPDFLPSPSSSYVHLSVRGRGQTDNHYILFRAGLSD